LTKWRCGVCGYVYDGDLPPEICPKCGASREKFTQIPEEESNLIARARITNQFHMELFGLLEKVREVAEMGIEDKLDPACVSLFEHALRFATELQQGIKAEIAGHIGKGKWG
jgi:predicted  nucleic acid-binding Zn-ribbon protein